MRRVLIDGIAIDPVEADIVEVEPGVFSILHNGRSFEARLDGRNIIVNGEALPFEVEDPRQWNRASGSAAHAGRAAIRAPMPGKIIRVLVTLNQEVAAGQGIVVVEAMKMQNELKAPRAARVAEIHVKEGDSVNAGATLAMLE